MKVLICGGRPKSGFKPSKEMGEMLVSILLQAGATEIVSGGAEGADQYGEKIAEFMDIPVRRFDPDWDKWPNTAGFIRNQRMVSYLEFNGGGIVIALPGGGGTQDTIRRAKAARSVYLIDLTVVF